MADNQSLEKQLEALMRELEKRKQSGVESGENSGAEREPSPERKHLHEIIGEKLYGEAERPAREEERHEDLPATHSGEERSYNMPELHDKVQKYVDRAFEKDLDTAIKEVQATNDAALIDAFHDAIVDELHDHLVNQGKLERL